MNIKFLNGTNFEYLNALETEEYWGGSSRRTLTIECEPGVISVDTLNDILSNENNVADITLSNEVMQAENVYSGYVLKLKCGIEPKLMSAESPEAAAVYEDKLVFKLGKRTYNEEQYKNLEATEAQAVYTAMMTDTLI